MTVAELRVALDRLPDDLPVIVQADGEGNSYSPVADVEEALYLAASTWEGERHEPDDPGAPTRARRAAFIVPTG